MLEIKELRGELALKNVQYPLGKARLAGSGGAGSPSEWTAEELSAQLAQGRAEIAYEKAKLRRIGKLEENTNVFTVFVPSWALKTPEGKESGNAVEVAEATPVAEQPLSVPTATDAITRSCETAVLAFEILSGGADNLQLSVAKAARASVEICTGPCADMNPWLTAVSAPAPG